MPNTTDSPRLRLAWYSLTIFLSSAILLVLEITAGRLIAPYVGVTLYSWTSIIGVILAGLSVGNWLGGYWADRGAGNLFTGSVLLLAGLLSLLSLQMLHWIAPLIQNSALDLVSSSFLYVLGMFFLPAVLLGIPTPLLTTLALQLDPRAGHIIGRMHALAAVGSIAGTFLTGFVLIQYFGSREVVWISALTLWLLAIPFFHQRRKIGAVLLLVSLILLLASRWAEAFVNPCDKESAYFCLRVDDISDELPEGNGKALILDHLMHGINHQQQADLLIAPYVHLMDELSWHYFGPEAYQQLAYFFAGGGSYTQPRAIASSAPQAKITVAELDPVVTELVQKEMYLDTTSMQVVHGDARSSLYRHADHSVDVMVTDAFHDIAIPYHLVTQEFVQLARLKMRPDGLFLTNIVDAYPDPKMVKSMMKTLLQEFRHVDVWLDQIPANPQRMTYVLSASDRPLRSSRINSRQGFNRQWFRVNKPLLLSGTSIEELPVFRDDYVPVERLIADLLLSAEGK